MSEWQDIATAPRDGTEVLLWNGRQRFLGASDSPNLAWMDFTNEALPSNPQPTHWQPLPEPPTPSTPSSAQR